MVNDGRQFSKHKIVNGTPILFVPPLCTCVNFLFLICNLSVQALSGPVLSAVGERYYKVTAEALRVCGQLVGVLRPNIEV